MTTSPLVEAADLVGDIRRTIRMLEAPCGFSCQCTRVAHTDAALVEKGDPPSMSFIAFVGEMRQSVAMASAYLAELIEVPGFVDSLRNLKQGLVIIGLYASYIEGVHHIQGDLPALAERLGTARNQGRFTDNAGTFVYVAYNDQDEVIYVGVTDDLFSRMASHRSSKRWWPHMGRIEWEEWPSREAALRKESTLIRRYRPRFNIAGNPDAKRNRT